MKKKFKSLSMSVLIVTVAAVVMSGCGSTKEDATPATSTAVTSTAPASPTPSPEAKKLSKEEQIALDYVNIYLNGSDAEAKKKFLADEVREDVQQLFQLGVEAVPAADELYGDPEVMDSVDYETDGMKGKLVLVNSSKGELIALVLEGKLGFVFINGDDEQSKKNFAGMKKEFK
ncbi:hypothetical protein [Paenibacillus sp. MMO-58]|uniref:hypothetical protein n=1 Tax=Paenibacillus sp. MMO-58 TaxID=3081290 RepID=UPI003016770D